MKPYWNLERETMAANFTVKNIPQDLYDKIRARAVLNRRSINGEIISILAATATPRPVNTDELLIRARALRGRTRGPGIDERFIEGAKREGRP